MPNSPAKVGMMMASVSRGDNVTESDVDLVTDLLSGVGLAVEVPEDQISAVIGVSGSSRMEVFSTMVTVPAWRPAGRFVARC